VEKKNTGTLVRTTGEGGIGVPAPKKEKRPSTNEFKRSYLKERSTSRAKGKEGDISAGG